MTSRRSETLFLAGERADPDTIEWAQAQLGVPVIDHWWADGNRLGHRRQTRLGSRSSP